MMGVPSKGAIILMKPKWKSPMRGEIVKVNLEKEETMKRVNCKGATMWGTA